MLQEEIQGTERHSLTISQSDTRDKMATSSAYSPFKIIARRDKVNLELILASARSYVELKGILGVAPPRTITCTKNLTFADATVSVDASKGTILVEIPTLQDCASATSIASGDLTGSFEVFRSFVHDFTFAVISNDTDEPMKNHFPMLQDCHDNATPDCIVTTPDQTYVLEFTTRAEPAGLQRAYDSKIFTYEAPLRARVKAMADYDRWYTYSVIAVSHDRVVTNLPLGEEVINELCARYRFARSIMSKASKEGYIAGEDTMDQIKRTIRLLFQSIKPEYDPPETVRGFTKEVIHFEGLEDSVARSRSFNYYKACLADAMMRKDVFNDGIEDHAEEQKKYWASVDKLAQRADLKSVIKFPAVLVANFGELPAVSAVVGDYSTLWDEIINSLTDNPDILAETAIQEIINQAVAEPEQEVTTSKRSEYHRMRPEVSQSSRMEFAKLGVEGKLLSGDPEVEMYREEKSHTFISWTDTDDIEEFVSSDGGEWASADLKLVDRIIQGLLKTSLTNYGPVPDHGLKALKWVMETVLYQWCDMVTDIGVELTISLKQNCKKGEFVIKKLKNFDVWMLVKPTVLNSHVFFTLMIPKESAVVWNQSTVFKQLIDCDTYWATEWVSFDVSKLVNVCKTAPFLITQVAQWARYYGLDHSKKIYDQEFWSMVKILLMVHLEDKSQTEEVMTLTRYVSMELFTELEPSRSKMLEKMPEFYRSRLALWGAKKLCALMLAPKYKQVGEFIPEDEAKPGVSRKVTWENIYNPFTGTPLDDPRKLIELYYVGYAKNKEEKSNPNQDMALLRKIVKYESKLEETDPELFGLKDPAMRQDEIRYYSSEEDSVPKTSINLLEGKPDVVEPRESVQGLVPLAAHEWSRSAVLFSVLEFEKYMTNTSGSTWRDILEDQIYSRLSKITWEQVATLKASSSFDPAVVKEPLDGRITTAREKVILRVIEELNNLGETPISSIGLVLEALETSGGLIIDIFKKSQHGGLREIYVLDLHSRLLQLCIEEISRALCQQLPSEVMMHPENKIRRPQQHLVQVARDRSKYKQNIASSNDAAVWNQGHHVLKFCQVLVRVLPTDFHGIIIRGLKLWTKKRIALPDGVLNMLNEHPGIQLMDKWSQCIVDAYSGLHPQVWLKAGSQYLETETGMMQGILHYTSSFFHAIMLLSRDVLFRTLCSKKQIKAYTCDMVSSDDSSRIVDVVSDHPEMKKIGSMYAIADQVCIKEFAKLFGISLSKKSTLITNWVMEFNSEWFVRINLTRPTLKWSLASLGMTEDEALYERQEVWYNQITELLEGGSGFRQAHLTQLAQGVLHYKVIGSSVNPLFMGHAVQLDSAPDPTLGFFLVDHPISAGLLGLSFSHWVHMTANREINCRAAQFLESGEMTTTNKGIVTRGCTIRFGERKRAQRLAERAEKIRPDWRLEIEEGPEVLYRAARDKPSSTLKILVKLTSPSVMTALSKANALSRVIASSVYIINRHAVTLSSAWMTALDGDPEYEKLRKTSLYKEATREPLSSRTLSSEEMDLLFPQRLSYESLLDTLSKCSQYVLVPGGSNKSLRSHVVAFSSSVAIPYSLETMVRWKWLKESLPTATRVLNEIWEYYKLQIGWLRENMQDTLEASKAFESHIQLRNFIARQGEKSRTVHLTGSPVRDIGTGDMVYNAIIRNQVCGKVLLSQEKKQDLAATKNLTSLQHYLVAMSTLPLTSETKAYRAREEIKSVPPVWDRSILMPSDGTTRLAIMQSFLKHEGVNKDETIALINKSKLGVTGGFKRRQLKDLQGNWKGRGLWSGLLGGVVTEIDMRDGSIKSITTNNIEDLRKVQSILTRFCEESGLTVPKDRTFSQASVFYNGRTITSTSAGCPVIQRDELKAAVPERDSDLEFKYSGGSYRLVTRNYGGPDMTFLAYRPQMWEFQPRPDPTRTSKSKLAIFIRCWVENQPMEPSLAMDLLTRGIEAVPSSYDPAEFMEFVKISLASSLTRKGWSFNSNRDLEVLLNERIEEETRFYEEADSSMFDDLDDFAEIAVEEAAVDDWDESLADWQGLESGLLEYQQTQYVRTDVRRSHSLWNSLVIDWASSISTRNKRLLCDKKYTERTEPIAKIFKHYFKWDMELHEERKVVSEEQNVEEELW